ncbi:AraC family transcriptional regulator [Methylobacterium sp. M6A4_1b]
MSRPGVGAAIDRTLRDLGADPVGLLAELRLDPSLLDGGELVPYADLGRLISLGAGRTKCPHLGLLVGQCDTLESMGQLGLLMRHSGSVGDALRALEAHAGIQNWGAVIGLGSNGGVTVLSYAPYDPEAGSAAIHSERALATLTNVLRALCGADWTLEEVLLPRSRPRDTSPYEHFFRAPVRFDQDVAAIAFSDRSLEKPIVGADPNARQRAEHRIRELEAKQSSNLTDELRRYLRIQVTRQRCKAERVARAQLVNRRTLSRHLQAEGTSFRRLANEAQFQVAQQLLVDTTLALGQISAALDFSEPAAFTHAFRRWSGMTPSAWRKANRP